MDASDATVEPRDPFIDLLRVVAIGVVVVGHWATTTIVWEAERVSSVNALAEIPATRLVTWIVQVMPLVFFAGGFANVMSLARAPDTLGYLQTRLRRLLTPAAAFLTIWLALGLAVELTDPSGPGKVRAAETAALPLWFLGIYVVVVAAAPAMWRLHRRARWWVPAGLAASVALVDVVAIGFDVADLGGLNYALVWLLAHQIGFFYADGTLRRMSSAAAAMLAAGGLAALVLLTTAGGYAVSLVGVPGGVRDNAEPPTLAMVAATVWLVGLVLSVRPLVLRRGVGRGRPVRFLHRMLLSTYLWHITALMVTAGTWRAAGLPDPEIGTAGWWTLRPLWVLAGLPPLVVLLAVVRRFEIHPEPPRDPRPPSPAIPVGIAFGVFAIAVGLLGFGETGFLPLAPLEGEAVLMFDFNPVQNVVHLLVGGGVLAACGSERWRVPALVAGSVAFLVVGFGEFAGLMPRLGMNDAGAVAHVVVGAAALLGAAAAVGIRRRSAPGVGA
jgi:peptidoglycan/LPS O-acetylase OafA/YrhL